MRSLVVVLALRSATAIPFTLRTLDEATYPMAKCLDGSAPGFYFAPGIGSGADNWLIHTQGGGWCVSDVDCANRAKSPLGSSSAWAPSGCDGSATDKAAPVCYADGGVNGMLSDSNATNPLLFNWNKVFINYCDGGSFAGARIDPVIIPDHNTTAIYYRGRYILDGVYAELFKLGLNRAATVVIKGCSAGGLAVFLHLDYLAAKIRAVSPTTRVVGAPGAGFFLGEAPPYSGSGYLANYQWSFDAHNVSARIDGFSSTNDACLAAHVPTNDTWRCFIAPELLPHIRTPLFVSNSLSDSWQGDNIMGLGCSPTKAGACDAAAVTYLGNFRMMMLDLLRPIMTPGTPHGGFLQGCYVHVVEGGLQGWTAVKIDGRSQAETFAAWLLRTGGKPLEVDIFPPWSNPTCG